MDDVYGGVIREETGDFTNQSSMQFLHVITPQ